MHVKWAYDEMAFLRTANKTKENKAYFSSVIDIGAVQRASPVARHELMILNPCLWKNEINNCVEVLMGTVYLFSLLLCLCSNAGVIKQISIQVIATFRSATEMRTNFLKHHLHLQHEVKGGKSDWKLSKFFNREDFRKELASEKKLTPICKKDGFRFMYLVLLLAANNWYKERLTPLWDLFTKNKHIQYYSFSSSCSLSLPHTYTYMQTPTHTQSHIFFRFLLFLK